MKATDLILDRFPSLSPQLQVAARFVVDHPNEVVIGSMRTLAERAQAQPATFVRLAQQLGPVKRLVTILCDTGFRYLSTLHDPEWRAAKGII